MTAANDTANPLTDGMPNGEVDEACIELRDVEALLKFAFEHTGALSTVGGIDCEREERDRVHLLLGMAKEKVAAVLESLHRYV